MHWQRLSEETTEPRGLMQGFVNVDGSAGRVRGVQQHGSLDDGCSMLEVPFSLREHDDVKTAGAYFPLGRYGFGADIVASGVCIVHGVLNPTKEQLPGIAECLSDSLRAVGAEEYARSLEEVRTRGQESILCTLVDKAIALVPRVMMKLTNSRVARPEYDAEVVALLKETGLYDGEVVVEERERDERASFEEHRMMF